MTGIRTIVAQLDATPRLPYALRSNPGILFNSFLTADSSRSKDDVSHVGQTTLNKMLVRRFGHVPYSRDIPRSEHWRQTNYSEFIRGFPQLRQECIGIVPQIRS